MPSSYAEFRFGGPTVIAAAIGIGLGMSPLPFYTIGVFAAPYIEEFGWTIGQIMGGLMPFLLGALVLGPIVGFLADRFGSRRVALTSMVLFSLTMMSFSLMNGNLLFYYFTWLMLAVTGAGTLPITFTRAVAGWFVKKRGLAFGIALIGTGLFGVLAKQYAFFLIELVGWRMAYVGVGALPLIIAFPIAFFMLRDVNDPKVADKVQRMVREEVRSTVRYGGLTLRQAVGDWRFWLLAYAFLPLSFAVGGPIPNMESILAEKQFTPAQAVDLASVIGIAVVIGRVVGGYIIDHFWAPAVAAVFLSLPAVATYMLAQPEYTYLFAAIAIFILGLAAGVEYDLMAYLVSRYFGVLHYAAIYGALYGFFAAGAAVGPGVFGWSYGVTGSFDKILLISSFLFLAGSLPLLLLGKYRDYEQPVEPVAAEREEQAKDPQGA